MIWYWFAARKNGEDRRERIPADSQTEAVSELEKMGYTDIVITDIIITDWKHQIRETIAQTQINVIEELLRIWWKGSNFPFRS